MVQPFAIRENNRKLAVYATRFIRKGEEIMVFEGKLISFKEAVSKGKRMGDPLQVEESLYLDLEQPASSINHSCDPNCGLINNRKLIAIRDIVKGEELTFDYSTTMDEDFWEMKCRCSSPSCRKIIRDFKFLEKNLQKKYYIMGIVPQFISRKYFSVPIP